MGTIKLMFKGRGLIQITGRKPYNGVVPPPRVIMKGNFEIIDKATVDGETWRTVQVEPKVKEWLVKQDKSYWYEHLTESRKFKVLDTFDISEKLYLMLVLRFSETG